MTEFFTKLISFATKTTSSVVDLQNRVAQLEAVVGDLRSALAAAPATPQETVVDTAGFEQTLTELGY